MLTIHIIIHITNNRYTITNDVLVIQFIQHISDGKHMLLSMVYIIAVIKSDQSELCFY